MNEELHTKADAPRAGHAPVRDVNAADGAPLRAERFDAAQMAHHAGRLAGRHVLAQQGAADTLSERLAENAAVIAAACAGLASAGRRGQTSAAAELLLEHYAVIVKQVHGARRRLPRASSGALPCLTSPAGQPRIHQLAVELVTHTDSLVEEEVLARFIAAYQESARLTLGELWALPVMLRLALLENLRRLAVRLEQRLRQRVLAAEWAARPMETLTESQAEVNGHDLGRELFAGMRRNVTTAEEGGITWR